MKSLNEADPGGQTALWDAIDMAMEQLVAFRDGSPDASAGCKLRILVLTDGVDTSE